MTETADPTTALWTGNWTAVPESISPIRAALLGYVIGAGASQRTRDAVGLAVSEAAANAVIHGFAGGMLPGQIAIRAWMLEPERLRVIITDDGRGMQPRTDSPGLGLGLPLIAQLADHVEIKSGLGEGTEVRMDFALVT